MMQQGTVLADDMCSLDALPDEEREPMNVRYLPSSASVLDVHTNPAFFIDELARGAHACQLLPPESDQTVTKQAL
jgi:hypothetical protein